MLGLPSWMKYVLELFTVILLFAVLVLINWALGLQQALRGPTGLREIWLGLIGLLIYLALRLFFFILNQLPTSRAEFPDIQEAFAESLETLAEAGINFRDVPVFLVVGLDPESESDFEQSPLVGQAVRIKSRRFPLHIFGDAQGLWITIPGISALVQQRESPTEKPATVAVPDEPAVEVDLPEDGDAAQFATIGAIGVSGIAGLSTAVRQAQAMGPRIPVRLSSQARELARRRLEYFMKLLRDARGGVCPLNAVLLMLPFDWIRSPEKCRLADAAGLDLSVIQRTAGVKCLLLTILTEIEASKEFTSYVQRLDKSELERRCGCGYPALTSYSPQDGPSLHRWLGDYFERQIYELYQRNLHDPENGILFRFLDQFRSWKNNFSRLMQYALPNEGEPLYFGGIYFASLGKVGSATRPFFDGVLAKLRREHDDVVGWNDQAVHADRWYYNSTLMLMALIAALTVIDAVLIVLILL